MTCINRNAKEYIDLRRKMNKMSDAAFDAIVGEHLQRTGEWPTFGLDAINSRIQELSRKEYTSNTEAERIADTAELRQLIKDNRDLNLPVFDDLPITDNQFDIQTEDYKVGLQNSIDAAYDYINRLKASNSPKAPQIKATYENLVRVLKEKQNNLITETISLSDASDSIRENVKRIDSLIENLKVDTSDEGKSEEEINQDRAEKINQLVLLKELITINEDILKSSEFKTNEEFNTMQGSVAIAKMSVKEITAQVVKKAVGDELHRRTKPKNINDNAKEEEELKELAYKKAADMFTEGFDYIGSEDNNMNLVLALDMNDANDPIASALKVLVDRVLQKDESVQIREELSILRVKVKKLFNNSAAKAKEVFERVSSSGAPRLVSKFSNYYIDAKEDIRKLQASIKKSESVLSPTQALTDRIATKKVELWDKVKDDFEVLDILKLPVDDLGTTDFYDASLISPSSSEAIAYKEKVILRLANGSDRKVGELLYKELIEEQRTKLRARRERIRTQISEEGNFERQNFLEDPMMAAKYALEPLGANINYEFAVFLPKADSPHLFDDKFAQDVESNTDVFEAWQSLKKGIKFVNDHRRVNSEEISGDSDLSLPYMANLVEEDNNFLGKIKMYSVRALDHILKAISRQPRPVSDDIKSNVNSVLEIATKRVEKQIPIYRITRMDLGIDYDQLDSLIDVTNATTQGILSQHFGDWRKFIKPDETQLPLKDFFLRHAVDEASKEVEDADIFDIVHNATTIVKVTKAQKEIESQVDLLRSVLDESKPTGSRFQTKYNTKRAVQYFLERKFYQYDRDTSKVYGKKYLTADQRLQKKAYEADIEFLENALKNVTGTKKEGEIKKAIEKLEKQKEAIGRIITFGSAFEGTFIRLRVLVGLGWNAVSQWNNKRHGDSAAQEGEGLFWKVGNIFKVDKYYGAIMHLRRRNGVTSDPQEKENAIITDTLLRMQGIFQNSSNELEELREADRGKERTWMHWLNPLTPVEKTEQIIQTPQILAMLADATIKDAKGNVVPVFNADLYEKENAHKGEAHPAFEMDERGVLILKADKDENGKRKPGTGFDTPENRNTWLNQNSEEHADLFSDSGYIPTMIRTLNGDYGKNTTTLAKSTVLGRFPFMFKTWAPMYLKWKKELFDILAKDQKSTRAALGMLSSKNLMAAIGTTSIIATFFPMFSMAALVGGPIIALSIYARVKRGDTKSLNDDIAETRKELLTQQKAINVAKNGLLGVSAFLRGTGAIGMKTFQSSVLFNNRLLQFNKGISQALIARVGGLDTKLKDAQGNDLPIEKIKEIQEKIAAYNALAVKGRDTFMALAVKIVVATLVQTFGSSIGDEDEEEAYEELAAQQTESNFLSLGHIGDLIGLANKDPERFLFNLTTNLSDQVITDSTLETNISDIAGLLVTVNPFGEERGILKSSLLLNLFDIEEKTKGVNRGQTGFEKVLETMFVPKLDAGLTTRVVDIYDKENIITKMATQSPRRAFIRKRKNVVDKLDVGFKMYIDDLIKTAQKESSFTEFEIKSIKEDYKKMYERGRNDLFPKDTKEMWNSNGTAANKELIEYFEKEMDAAKNYSEADIKEIVESTIAKQLRKKRERRNR